MNMEGKYRLKFHLMPPSGWMNDPNGLCCYNGRYHVFFQYAPKDPEGKERCWGHYSSINFLDWIYEGIALKSDSEWDRDGAYSGCAYTDDGIMELFYTGNVKHAGDYDYITSGREANVITVKSKDGVHFGEKKLLLTNAEYPEDYTCHVRDPKVWKNNSLYYMIVGGRKKEDKGTVMQYVSIDKIHWEYNGEITTDEKFGYMWECPDAFELDDVTVLMCCPQGLDRGKNHFQNMYQSGYFVLTDRKKERLSGSCDKKKFMEWDMGFDFYAPQTMMDKKGKRVLMGWAGVPDMEKEYNNKPIIDEGWQHSLTVPRELTRKGERVYQYPVEELNLLRYDENIWKSEEKTIDSSAFDLEIKFDTESVVRSVVFDSDVRISWRDGLCELEFLSDCGQGRDKRRVLMDNFEHMRILKDVSMLEIYINHGEEVMTTRYYPKEPEKSAVVVRGAKEICSWKMNEMEVAARYGAE